MTITYRTTGAWGAGKGSNLTAAEVDENFYDLDLRLDALEAALPAANEIDSFEVTGINMTVTMEDDSVLGPIPLPVAVYNFRGPWAASTAYNVLDVVYNELGSYVVRVSHTSASTFDPAAVDGSSNLYYQAMTLNARREFNVINIDVADDGIVRSPALSETGSYYRFHTNSPNEAEFKIPNNATVAFPIGTEFTISQRGTAVVLIWVDGTDDIYSGAGSDFTTSGVGTVVTVRKVDTTEWELYGEYAV